jgi:hypothetical protein
MRKLSMRLHSGRVGRSFGSSFAVGLSTLDLIPFLDFVLRFADPSPFHMASAMAGEGWRRSSVIFLTLLLSLLACTIILQATMGAPLDPTTAAHVSFVESFTQPDAVRPSEIVAAIPAETEVPTSIRKRPSIVVGGDIGALAVVQLVHSPRSTSGSTSPCAVSGSVSPPTSPKVRGAWRCKLFGSTWTGPADVIFSLVSLTYVAVAKVRMPVA